MNFDTAKLGLWKGGAIRTHTEYAFGGLRANLGGAVLPMVLGVKLPNPGDRKHVDVTSIYLAQRISERVNLMIGKINPLDLLANDPFWGGAGHARFFSVGLGSPPNGLQTPVIMGTILSVHTQPIDWTMMVFDPSDRTRDYRPGDLFERGVSISLGGTHRRTIAGRTSSLTLTGIYTTADSVNLGEILLPPELQTGPREDAYHVGLQFSHFLKEDPMTRGQGWGFFLKMGGSDGRSNPFQSFISGGFGGSRLFGSRPRDSFGIGYFYVNFSDQLQNALNPLARFNDEQGVEAFYNIHIKQWLQLSGDLYFVNPAPAANKNALAGGLRLKFRL